MKMRPTAHYIYLPSDRRYFAGVVINRAWDELSNGMKRSVSATVKRLLERNKELSWDREWR